jgi:hypothetical protein
MTLAIFIVIAAVIALAIILQVAVTRSLQTSRTAGLAAFIQPIDVEAFRNLGNPAEDEYLRLRLPPPQFRHVRRQRLLAMAAYVKAAGRNADVLMRIGHAALASPDARAVQAAQQLVSEAALLRRNAALSLAKIYVAMAWPNSGLVASRVADGYEHLNGSAMLLGRLQNPAVPVRLSAALR